MIKKTILGSLFMTCALTASAQYLPNSGFDTWKTTNGETTQTAGEGSSAVRPGTEPEGWNGSNIHQVFDITDCVTKPDDGDYVKIANYNMFGQIIPGYMTLATPWVFVGGSGYGEMMQLAKYGDGGSYGGTSFTYKPDAISLKYRRTGGTGETSHVIAYLWSGTFKSGVPTSVTSRGVYTYGREMEDVDRVVMGRQTENVSQTGSLIASLDYEITADQSGWKELVIPFTYQNSTEAPEKMNVILAASDYWTRPNLKGGTTLDVDDVQFVYYSELASLTYNSESVEIPSSGTIDLSDQVYDATKLSYTLTGKGATAEITSYDEATAVLTLTVKGNDWSVNNDNQHVYTIQFAKPAPASEVVGQYNRWISVTMMNNLISESANNISLTKGDNGKVTFSLDYFTLVPGGDNLGPVAVPNAQLVYAADGSINITAPSQDIAIPGLGGKSLSIALSANMTADKKLTASLDIPDYYVKVTVGDIPFTTVEEGKVLKVTGTVSKLGASSVKGESTANVLDLTGATLGEGLATDDFAAGANDLFLIADGQTLDGNNVIKDGVCDNFVLTDGQSFNAPEGFTANQITYKRAVASSTDKDEVYTFVLPFTFTADKVNGTVYELSGVNAGVLDFTSLEGSMELKANRPYLVVSNGTQLLNASAFSGEVVATGDLTNEVYGGVTMVGAYEATPITSGASESWYGYNANGQFVKATTGTINPFRTAIKSTGIAPSSYALKLDGTVTGIVNLENPNAKVDVYTISGVCVRKNVPAASALNGLSRGVYIVGGQKVVK